MRSTFEIIKRPSPSIGYDVHCRICGKTSAAWDFRANALGVGWAHALEHVPDVFKRASWQ